MENIDLIKLINKDECHTHEMLNKLLEAKSKLTTRQFELYSNVVSKRCDLILKSITTVTRDRKRVDYDLKEFSS